MDVLFNIKWKDIFYNPFYFTRLYLQTEINKLAPSLKGTIIDLGCGTKPYQHLFVNATKYIGVDVEISGNTTKQFIDVFYDGKILPFEDNSIDNIFSSETFEHIFNLEEIIPEIFRVLKPNGQVLITCPFLWPEHEKPYDYARYTSFGIQHLLVKNGFNIIDSIKTGSYISSVLQLIALYIYYFISKIPILKYLLFIVFITPLFILGLLIDKIFPLKIKRNDLFLNNVILVQKP